LRREAYIPRIATPLLQRQEQFPRRGLKFTLVIANAANVIVEAYHGDR
jgi:hypothetical protein